MFSPHTASEKRKETAETNKLGYLDQSATAAEGDDSDDMSAVGVSFQSAGGVIEPQVILTESLQGTFINLYSHLGLIADHSGFI